MAGCEEHTGMRSTARDERTARDDCWRGCRQIAAAAIVGYLLGSIPSGVLVGHLFRKGDPRTRGSGKTGATNVLRTAGRGPALLVVCMDIAKGVIPVLIAGTSCCLSPAGRFRSTQRTGVWRGRSRVLRAAWAQLLGVHPFPRRQGSCDRRWWSSRHDPLAVLFGFVALVVPIALTRYVSLGSIIGAAVAGIAALILALTGHDYMPHAVFALSSATVVIASHHDNIHRLLQGTERKFGERAH